MKGQRKFKFSLLLTAIAVLAFIALFAYSLFLILGAGVAFAEDVLRLEISLDGENWILSDGNAVIATEQGKFFDASDNEAAVSVKFKAAIDKAMADNDKSEYLLNFKLPNIDCTVNGSSTFDYTEDIGNFVVKAIYMPVISSNVTKTMQYRRENGEFENDYNAVEVADGLAFGQNKDVGSYYVRVVVREIFTFDGREYSVPRYSGENFCTINKATPVAPEMPVVSVVYGTAAKDIASALSRKYGLWTLSDTQSLTIDKNTILHVRNEVYKIKFDFSPHNKNYHSLTGVEADIKITPRKITVVVNDAFSLIGEPVATDLTYRVASALAEGDRIEDLNITINTDNVNTAVAGHYVLTAEVGNPDYVARSVNASNSFIDGGKYIVYATSIAALAPDGVIFDVLLDSGFDGVTFRIELCDNVWWDEEEAYPINGHVYRLIFENSRGERVFLSSNFSVTWRNGAFDKAKFFGTVLADATKMPIRYVVNNGATVDGNTDVIAFFEDILIPFEPLPNPSPNKLSAGAIAGIVVGSLCGAALIALAIIIPLLLAKKKKNSATKVVSLDENIEKSDGESEKNAD